MNGVTTSGGRVSPSRGQPPARIVGGRFCPSPVSGWEEKEDELAPFEYRVTSV